MFTFQNAIGRLERENILLRSRDAAAVRKTLSKVIEQRSAPLYLRSDNGPEFIRRDLKIWLACQGNHSHFIKPGSPWQNGHAESFMSRLRAECLDAGVFQNLLDSRLKLGIYRRYYNQQRPHSALNYVPPAVLAAALANIRIKQVFNF